MQNLKIDVNGRCINIYHEDRMLVSVDRRYRDVMMYGDETSDEPTAKLEF